MVQTVAEVMTPAPVTISAEDTVATAAGRMRDHDVGALIVSRGGRAVGILTDRDIVVRAVADERGPDAAVGDVYSGDDLRLIHPETPIDEAVELMRRESVRRLPVVDGERRPVGIISLGDLAIERDDTSALADICAAEPNV